MTQPAERDSDKTPETGAFRYPIDESMIVPMQGKAAQMRGKELNLVVGARIFDFSNPVQVNAFFAELGPDAVRPADNGVHHLFWIKTDTEKDPVPILIPQAFVLWFMLGVGVRDSVSTAAQFVSREGVLPMHDPAVEYDEDDLADEDEQD